MSMEMQDKLQILTTMAQQTRVDELKMNEQVANFVNMNLKNEETLTSYIKDFMRLSFLQSRVLSTLDRVEREVNSLKVGLSEAYRGYLSRELISIEELHDLARPCG